MSSEEPRVRETDRRRAEALMSVGKDYIRAGRFDEALKILEQAVAFDPQALRPQLGLGITLARLGRYDEARAVATAMFKIQRNAAGGHNVLGACYEGEGKTPAARRAYEQAVFFGADVAVIQYNCCCFWAREGDAARCRRYLENALKLDATLNAVAATDVDLARYRDEPWFEELVAFKR
jgi:Flp pilus assembly protein TadD